MATETKISYLGHAGFIIEHAGTRILMDPWFYPAFLESWFPYPDNRGLLMDVVDGAFDYLYVSHAHEDHFDRRLLDRLDKSITVLTPKYRSKVVERNFRKLGRIQAVIATQSFPANRRILPPVSATRASCGTTVK